MSVLLIPNDNNIFLTSAPVADVCSPKPPFLTNDALSHKSISMGKYSTPVDDSVTQAQGPWVSKTGSEIAIQRNRNHLYMGAAPGKCKNALGYFDDAKQIKIHWPEASTARRLSKMPPKERCSCLSPGNTSKELYRSCECQMSNPGLRRKSPLKPTIRCSISAAEF